LKAEDRPLPLRFPTPALFSWMSFSPASLILLESLFPPEVPCNTSSHVRALPTGARFLFFFFFPLGSGRMCLSPLVSFLSACTLPLYETLHARSSPPRQLRDAFISLRHSEPCRRRLPPAADDLLSPSPSFIWRSPRFLTDFDPRAPPFWAVSVSF